MAHDTPTRSRVVAGEPAVALARAFLKFKTVILPDGRVRFDAELDGKEGAPLARALMRVEAELLVKDAEKISADRRVANRTPAQRRADALVAVVLRVQDALA